MGEQVGGSSSSTTGAAPVKSVKTVNVYKLEHLIEDAQKRSQNLMLSEENIKLLTAER